MWLFGQNLRLMRMQYLRIHTSLMSSFTVMGCTVVPRWWVTEMCGFHNFFPASLPASYVCNHVPIANNFMFAFAQKNFQTCVPSMHKSVSALLSDGYVRIQ